MDAGHDFADAGSYTSLVTQVGNVLACFANNDASLLGRDNGAEGDLLIGVLFLGANRAFDVVAGERVAGAEAMEVLRHVGDIVWRGNGGAFICRHGGVQQGWLAQSEKSRREVTERLRRGRWDRPVEMETGSNQQFECDVGWASYVPVRGLWRMRGD